MIIKIKKYQKLFPNMLALLVISHIIYYWLVFSGKYNELLPLIILALSSSIAGYGLSKVFNNDEKKFQNIYYRMEGIDYKRIVYLGIVYIIVGLIAHLGFYGVNIEAFDSYSNGYFAGRGNGYVTVFFNFLILGIVLIEYAIKFSRTSFALIIFNRIMILGFTICYLFLFMKRRQVLLLFVCLFAIHFNKIRLSRKIMLYIIMILTIIALTVFGKVRGYFDANGFNNMGTFIINNYSNDWISISEMEGKYISRTFNDVYKYVSFYGYNPQILIGVIFCMIPRKLLGGFKPLSFPEWNTYTFHFLDYQKGAGYAGSLVAELYLIGGVVIIIIGYFIIGSICYKMQRKVNIAYKFNQPANIISVIFVYTIAFLPRFDLASLFIDFVFLYIPMILVFKYCKIKVTKKNSTLACQLHRNRRLPNRELM